MKQRLERRCVVWSRRPQPPRVFLLLVLLLSDCHEMMICALVMPRQGAFRRATRRITRQLFSGRASLPLRFDEIPRNRPTPHSPPSNNANKYQQLMDASTLSLAPMMDYTDRHFRRLIRLISNRTLLYTEMVAANALAHERRAHLAAYAAQHPTADEMTLRANYDDEYMLQRFLAQAAHGENPTVLQLGGSDPQILYEAAQAVMELSDRSDDNCNICNYTALNLNCGCPSPKVAGNGCFGAALMDEPALVAELVRALHEGCAGRWPVTVKCRIGTDASSSEPFTKQTYAQLDKDAATEYRRLAQFVETVASTGVVTDFAVHARIAVLKKSFSPADNRKIPPLKYDLVRQLVQDYPQFTFTLNGGVETISQVQDQLAAAPGLKGVMVGRAFAADPWSFAMADELLYGQQQQPVDDGRSSRNRLQILQEYGKHADEEEQKGDPVKIRRFITKAVTPLFAGEPKAKRYRIALDEIVGIPKKLSSQGKSLASQPPLSELIMNAATKHLSEETLLRSPQESYERVLWEEQKRINQQTTSRSRSVTEWQNERFVQAPIAESS